MRYIVVRVKPLHDFLSNDHDRLDVLLAACTRRDGTVDMDQYTEFRRGLLRHIAIEEKVLFPAIRAKQGSSELIEQLHRDHAALAALLVPPPAAAEIEQIRGILREHNPLEEEADGLYEIAEQVAGSELSAMVAAANAMPIVPVAPHVDTAITRDAIKRLLSERLTRS
ncbi:MAG: hemerythrin domain-containing protein [Thermoanaerobaculia bacterium]